MSPDELAIVKQAVSLLSGLTGDVAAPAALPRLDASAWIQGQTGWVITDDEISYTGSRFATLTSPRKPVPAGRKAVYEADAAGDVFEIYAGKACIIIDAWTEAGTWAGYKVETPLIATGLLSIEADFPVSAVTYSVRVMLMGRTIDGKVLLPRIRGLRSSDA